MFGERKGMGWLAFFSCSPGCGAPDHELESEASFWVIPKSTPLAPGLLPEPIWQEPHKTIWRQKS